MFGINDAITLNVTSSKAPTWFVLSFARADPVRDPSIHFQATLGEFAGRTLIEVSTVLSDVVLETSQN